MRPVISEPVTRRSHASRRPGALFSARRRPSRPPRTGAAELTALADAVSTGSIDEAAGVQLADVPGAHPDAMTPTAMANLQRRLVDHPPRQALVRVWWAGLGDDVRRALGLRAPLAVGNLDGVPWPARVAANHRVLAEHVARGEARDPLIGERLAALATGPGLVKRPDGRARFLLAFDPARHSIVEYVGHAIADTDDPFASPLDESVTAVALFVPGNESDLAQFEAKAHTMSELVHAGAPGTTGLIVWQSGRFPRGPLGLSSGAAVRLARRFGAFVNAIPRASGVRFVAFGFSFGGSVVGTAMRFGMRVDAVTHVASAGLGPGVRSLDDYPASARVPHTSMLAPGDREVAPFLGIDVPRGPRGIGHGADPTATRGVVRLETGFVRHVRLGDDVTSGLDAGILRGHATLLERWGTTAKAAMRASLVGGTAELAANRTPLERLSERLGLRWSPLQRDSYEPRFIHLPGSPRER